jgi:diguanylate cyclase (GGDEF)-like protein/PAS domain S-box-containing protein
VNADYNERKQVLIIQSYHRGYEWSDNIENGIKSVLASDENDINIKIEYMDTERVDDKEYYKKLMDLYKYKYEDEKFHVIICCDDAAFNLLVENRNELLPSTPIVFCGVNNLDISLLKEGEDIKGITEDADIESNVELIVQLHPYIDQIIIVLDNTILGENSESVIKRLIRKNKFAVPITIVKGESLQGTIEEINTFSKNSAIIYMASRFKEKTGQVIFSDEGLQAIKSSVDMPIYGVWDNLLDNGIIGGKLTSGFYHGQVAGEMAKRILFGDYVENISIKNEKNKKYTFDYNELKSYRINFSQIPVDSVVINTPASVYSIAKTTIKQAAIVIMIIFAVIILLLIINILKRRKAQNQLKESRVILEKNLKFIRVILNTIPNPIFLKNAEGRYIECNSAFTEFLGLKKEHIIGRTVFEINQGSQAYIYYNADNELMEKKGNQSYETKVKHADGTEHDVLFSKAIIISEKNEVEGIVGVILDISERKKIEKKMNGLLKLKEAMLEVNHSIIETDNINELFRLILEKAIESIEGGKFGSVLLLNKEGILEIVSFKGFDPKEVKEFSLPLEKSFEWLKTKGNIEKTIIIDDIHKLEDLTILDIEENKKKWHIKSSISSPLIIDNQLYGMINIDSNNARVFNEEHIEIMEYLRGQVEIAVSKHNLFKETVYLSKYDKLTNVYNRRYFEEVFDKYFGKAVRYNEEFHLVIFDINGLKIVNDTYGHLAGDEYVKTFAASLSGRIRSSDILARYGGDEFVAVFFQTDLQSLVNKFEKLIEDLKNNPIIFEQKNIICGFSYGIANFPSDAKTYNRLVKIADERMYKYKERVKSSNNLKNLLRK